MALSSVKTLSVVVAGSFLFLLNACGGAEKSSDAAPVENSSNDNDVVSHGVEATDNPAVTINDAVDDLGAPVDETVADAADSGEAIVTLDSDDAAAEYAALTGDATKGRRVFGKCMACHTVQEGQNRVGPSLYGIIGAPAGAKAGFNYTDANANSGVTWTEETMFLYLENPMEFMPGTRMIFPGLPSAQDRADVIAYLKSSAE